MEHLPVSLKAGVVYIIGDIHGYYDKLAAQLQTAGLVNSNLTWQGGRTRLWFLGDFFDRGPNGVGVLDLIMRLQREADDAGGQVRALVGNHELQILAAYHFADRSSGGPGKTFTADWKRNGGIEHDLRQLTSRHVEWLSQLPAMAYVDGRLLAHADALAYTRYGLSIEEVNDTFMALMQSDDTAAWDQALADFSEHEAFVDSRADGADRARAFLVTYGGAQIIHGHSPISKITRQAPHSVTTALVYARGLCIDVDSGMYLGSPGFVYKLPQVV